MGGGEIVPRGGHNRKPTNLKVIQGTARKDRINDHEPKPKPIAPKPPSGMSKEAKKFWKAMAPKLEELGLLTELDGPAFANLCETWATINDCRKTLAKEGYTIPDAHGIPKKHPVATVLAQQQQQFRLLGADFGLSPSPRGRIDVKNPNEGADPFEEFLKRGAKNKGQA